MPTRVRVVRDEGAIRALLIGPSGAVAQDLVRRGQRVLNQAKRNAPVDTGALRASLNMQLVTINGAPAVRIGSGLPYAIFVHEGTGIYGRGTPIVPVRATILRWPAINNSGSGNRRYSGGATRGYVFAHSVRGVPGRPFLLDALDAAR